MYHTMVSTGRVIARRETPLAEVCKKGAQSSVGVTEGTLCGCRWVRNFVFDGPAQRAGMNAGDRPSACRASQSRWLLDGCRYWL